MFSELSENFGLLSLFHIDPQISYKQILSDVESFTGSNYIPNRMDILNESGIIINNPIKNEKSEKNFYGKHKCGNHQFLILTPISSFIFVALKYREKGSNDEKILMDNLKDLKTKFINFHVFKYLLSENS